MYSLLFTICWTRVIHGTNWWEHEGWSPLPQRQLLWHHQGFQLFKVLATRCLSSAAGHLVTSPQPWPGYKCTAVVQWQAASCCPFPGTEDVWDLHSTSHRCVLASNQRALQELNWTHDCPDSIRMHQFNSPIFSSTGVVVSHCSKDWTAMLHNCEEIKPNYVLLQFGWKTWQTRTKCYKCIVTIMDSLD